MKFLNFKLWGPFYFIGLFGILYILWTVEAIRPKGAVLIIGTILILILVILNSVFMYLEIRAHEKKEDNDRALAGLEPLPKKKGLFKRRG
jgi:hypothetical protein